MQGRGESTPKHPEHTRALRWLAWPFFLSSHSSVSPRHPHTAASSRLRAPSPSPLDQGSNKIGPLAPPPPPLPPLPRGKETKRRGPAKWQWLGALHTPRPWDRLLVQAKLRVGAWRYSSVRRRTPRPRPFYVRHLLPTSFYFSLFPSLFLFLFPPFPFLSSSLPFSHTYSSSS